MSEVAHIDEVYVKLDQYYDKHKKNINYFKKNGFIQKRNREFLEDGQKYKMYFGPKV